MHDSIVRQFADAGLALDIARRPIVFSVGSSIVQFDIRRGSRGLHEWFRLFRGANDNRVEVVGSDRKLGQVVVLVHEPPRPFVDNFWLNNISQGFTTKTPGWRDTVASRLHIRPDRIQPAVSKNGVVDEARAFIHRVTSDQKRHMLCGLDERHLFIAQLPTNVSTVRDAHAALKAPAARVAENRGDKIVRQGEWFFIEATAAQSDQIEDSLRRNVLFLERSVPIGPFTVPGSLGSSRKVRQVRGNPHTADELVVVPSVGSRPGLPATREVFVRGRVRHAEHATVRFQGWHAVVRNREATPVAVGWVD